MTWTRGAGSMRERRPGVWEARVALGPDLVSGRTAVRSLTVHGDRRATEDGRARIPHLGRYGSPPSEVCEDREHAPVVVG
jgi:hypothetical protein